MQKITLSVDLVNNIFNYLQNKPFKEVAPMIGQLMEEVNKKEDTSSINKAFTDQEIKKAKKENSPTSERILLSE